MADYDLKSALKKMGKKKLNASFYKGDKGNQLLVTSKPPTAKQVGDLDAECGEVKRLFKGVCFFETDAFVVAVKSSPSPSWQAALTKVFKDRKCAEFLPAVIRTMGEGESDEVMVEDGPEGNVQPGSPEAPTSTAPPPPPPPPPAGDAKAKLDKLKTALAPHIKTAIADPAKKEALTKLLSAAAQSEKAGAFPDAIKAFESMVPILKAAPSGAPSPTAPPTPETAPSPPPPPQTSPQEALAAFTARLKAIMPELAKALAAKNPAAESAKAKATAAGGLVKKQDFAGANLLLDEVEGLLAGAESEQEGKELEGEQKEGAEEQKWNAALAKLEPTYLAVLKGNPANGTRLRALMDLAQENAGNGNYAEAIGMLGKLEALLAEGGPSDTASIVPGLVNYRKSLLAFAAAKSQVDAQIATLKAAIPATVPEERELAGAVADYLNAWNSHLSDTIDAAINAAKNEQEPCNEATRKEIHSYLSDLNSNGLIAHTDSNPISPVAIRATLGAALRNIEAAMPKL